MIRVIFFLCTVSLFAQQREFQKGQINDSIPVAPDTGETYALYLPERYDPTELSPIVFIFDPVARGKQGIGPFIDASEKYGYILVCSNDSRNGPYPQNFEIANRLFTGIFAEFLVDERRIYTAGFSGGARLASTIAVLTKQIEGVIACGAGFSRSIAHQPGAEKFSYAAIVGDEDMNLSEMYSTRDWLDKLNVPNELFIDEFAHRWPPQNQILAAFDWLQLEAFKKGFMPKNDEDIKRIYNLYYDRALKFEQENRLTLAADEYQRLMRNFRRYFQVDSVAGKLKSLKNNKHYKRQKRSLEAILEKEATLLKQFYEKLTADLEHENPKIDSWKSEIDKVKSRIDHNKTDETKMLKRILYGIYAMAIETVRSSNRTFTMDQRILCYEICIYSQPENPIGYLVQIANYLKMDNVTKARHYLGQLLKLGYDIEYVRNHIFLKGISNTDEFKLMIKT